MKKIILLIVLITVFYPIDAQNRYNYFTIGAQVNSMNYFGDLNPTTSYLSTNISLTRPGFGFQATYKATPRFHFRGSLLWGRLQGDDYKSADPGDTNGAFYRYARNLNFRNDIIEFSLTGVWDFIPHSGRFYRRRAVTPYVFGGIAVFYNDPRGKAPDSLGGKWVRLRPLHTEGQGKAGYAKPYSAIQLAIPFGAGARFKIADRLDLSIEVGLRYTLTDYVDDVGGSYADPNDLDSDLARIMSNPSALATSTLNGNARDLALLNTNLGFITITPTSGTPYQSVKGYGQKDDIRGSSKKDLYLITGFHLSYIFAIKRYRPFVPKEK